MLSKVAELRFSGDWSPSVNQLCGNIGKDVGLLSHMSPKSLVKNKSTLSSWPSAANCSLPISSCRCGMIQRFNETSWVKTSWNIDSSEARSLQFSHCWSADIWVMERWYKKLLGHLLPKQFQDKCRMTTYAFPGLVNICKYSISLMRILTSHWWLNFASKGYQALGITFHSSLQLQSWGSTHLWNLCSANIWRLILFNALFQNGLYITLPRKNKNIPTFFVVIFDANLFSIAASFCQRSWLFFHKNPM